jgi:phage tail-like protein
MTLPSPAGVVQPDPLPKHRFIVTLDPGDAYLPPAQAMLLPLLAAGAFQEVTGLGGQLEVTAYAEGGLNDSVHQLPLRHSWNRLVLKRGVARLPGLWSWYAAGLAGSLGARRDGAVVLFGPDGRAAAAWSFRAGLAAKWTGPDLHAEQSAVAVESLEIAHEGLTQVGSDAVLNS